MKKNIETSIEIKAAPQKVWEILSNTPTYGEWNPFVRSIVGLFEEGKTVFVTLNPPGGGTFKFKPRVLKATFPELRWGGKFIFKGLFDGEHYFRVEKLTAESVRFVHGENFSGILVGLMGSILTKTENCFRLMNTALKELAER